jgi:hypothetical protein
MTPSDWIKAFYATKVRVKVLSLELPIFPGSWLRERATPRMVAWRHDVFGFGFWLANWVLRKWSENGQACGQRSHCKKRDTIDRVNTPSLCRPIQLCCIRKRSLYPRSMSNFCHPLNAVLSTRNESTIWVLTATCTIVGILDTGSTNTRGLAIVAREY